MKFRIFTAPSIWGKEGTIAFDGGVYDPSEGKNIDLVPKGTYAIRWTNPDWFWAKDGVCVDSLPHSESQDVKDYWKHLGDPPVEQYTFKNGPLGDGDKAPYFEFPLAGVNGNAAPPPDVADTLVMQVVEPVHVEYLTKGESPADPVPLPPDLGLIKDVEWWDPCAIPEFCKPVPAPGGKGIICLHLGWFEFCPKKEQTAMGLVRVRDLSAAVARYVFVARTQTSADGRVDADAQAALRVASERARNAQHHGRELRHARSELLDTVRQNARTPHSVRFAVQMSLEVELGLRALDRCAARLDQSPEDGLDALLGDARLAHRNFDAALIQLQRLETWALPAELKAGETETISQPSSEEAGIPVRSSSAA